jgi:hypothetical protein
MPVASVNVTQGVTVAVAVADAAATFIIYLVTSCCIVVIPLQKVHLYQIADYDTINTATVVPTLL